MNKFAERLKKLRAEREISQAVLARVLKTYQQAIDKWERGIIMPSMDTIMQLCMYFGVTADYLIGLSDEIIKPQKPPKNDPSGAYDTPKKAK